MPSETSRKRIAPRIIFDIILLFIVATPILLFYTDVFTPFKRGYFCDDETLRYPYIDSTVSDLALYIVGLSAGVVSIILCELVKKILSRTDEDVEHYFLKGRVPSSVLCLYSSTIVFLFGFAITEITTNFIKYTLGRLRPNFFYVCQSDFNCTSSTNPHLYVEDYHCTNPDTHSATDSRLSFPSGHSSIAAYSALFSVIYIQKYLVCPCSKLLKPALQFILILLAVYTAVSRIGDNKHHWSDVIGGITLGIIIASSVSLTLPHNSEEVSEKTMESKESYIAKSMELS